MGSEEDKKLTKKQLKAQQFRKSKEEKDQEKDVKKEQAPEGKRPNSAAGNDGEEPVKKKEKHVEAVVVRAKMVKRATDLLSLSVAYLETSLLLNYKTILKIVHPTRSVSELTKVLHFWNSMLTKIAPAFKDVWTLPYYNMGPY